MASMSILMAQLFSYTEAGLTADVCTAAFATVAALLLAIGSYARLTQRCLAAVATVTMGTMTIFMFTYIGLQKVSFSLWGTVVLDKPLDSVPVQPSWLRCSHLTLEQLTCVNCNTSSDITFHLGQWTVVVPTLLA
eukprot:TRINITY_DN8632_c0_g1_i4.p1 TRINITY_DN8632_c0_g1~~TRINITY_DN8632_c0_g1_i4.p1  ORF type:complete len:135 (-),score=10.13 TRINITY_DN8632_c0_g1_i4:383-787(-)